MKTNSEPSIERTSTDHNPRKGLSKESHSFLPFLSDDDDVNVAAKVALVVVVTHITRRKIQKVQTALARFRRGCVGNSNFGALIKVSVLVTYGVEYETQRGATNRAK